MPIPRRGLILSRRRRSRDVYVHVRAEDEENYSVARGVGEEEEEEEEGGDEESDSEETEEEDDGEEVEYIEVTDSPRVYDGHGEKGATEGRVCSPSGNGSQENGWDRNEIDGLFCPICMEAWATSGDHHLCCLPCGHIYGFSCITKWLKQEGSSRKCPQCNRKCTLKDVRKHFASQIVAIDGESQKRIKSLEAKCISLEKKASVWCKKESEWKKKEAGWKKMEAEWHKREFELQSDVCRVSETANYLKYLLGDAHNRQKTGSDFNRQGRFVLQKQLKVNGARLFDVHQDNQFLIVARRLPGLGGAYVLSKMSLLPSNESEDIQLPCGTKAVRDLHFCHYNGSLVLFATLGRKLSILSAERNTITLSYDLPTAAWSCLWDQNSVHHVYAGLQNGSVLAFDIRQTATPLHSVRGLTNNPVHTLCSLRNSSVSSNIGAIISASSVGICHWNFSGDKAEPHLISGAEDQGVCISLAYCFTSDNIVASYRPRIDFQNEMAPVIGQGVLGSHVHFKRENDICYQKLSSKLVNVNDVRLPRSAIINTEKHGCLFAAVDEIMGELILQELPSFAVVEHLKSPKDPIYDVKYMNLFDKGLLGVLSEDALQLFSLKL